jgi:hypothetical protein
VLKAILSALAEPLTLRSPTSPTKRISPKLRRTC